MNSSATAIRAAYAAKGQMVPAGSTASLYTKKTPPANAAPLIAHSMLPYFLFFRSAQYSKLPATAPPKMDQTHSTRPNLCLSAGPRQRSKGESVTVGEVS